MKNINLKVVLAIILVTSLFSCDPRIEMDMTQWGDKALLTNVQLFNLQIDPSAKIYEWAQNGDSIAGVRQVIISTGNAVIDLPNFTATVKLASGKNLVGAGIIFYFYGSLIEPLNGAPKPGIVSNISAGSFKYRVHSADGSSHDWTIIITL